MVEHFLQGQILFGQVSPEILLENLLNHGSFGENFHRGDSLVINSEIVSEKAYLHFSKNYSSNARRTVDEQIQRYNELNDFLNPTPKYQGGIFRLLSDYGNRVLNLTGIAPTVKQEKILEWRETSLALGQDIFTCAALAEKDTNDKTLRRSFIWPPALQTDNIPLQHLLNAGCAENHYHLNGSTQIFPLAWCYLMNHPSKLASYFADQKMQDNLKATTHTSIRDNMMGWVEKMSLAVWIRATLFMQIEDLVPIAEANSFAAYCSLPDRKYQLRSMVKQCRRHAAELSQGKTAHRLDYAITPRVSQDNKGPVRLLAGERWFLYHCFYRCYTGKFSREQMNLLYLYLLIKRDFRNELIQTNGRRGFWNFAEYQDRKAIVWGESPAYWRESYILSLAENLDGPRAGSPILRTLETRITPRSTASEILDNIHNIDSTIEEYQEPQNATAPKCRLSPGKKYFWEKAQENARYFYVMHFTKKPLKRVAPKKQDQKQWLPARNHDVRKKAEYQAKALAQGLAASSYLCSRIRGIDACSREIGCRPETFATQFRYLRSSLVPHPRHQIGDPRYWPKLGATYHAGEDFLDLTDGLRAIDEAICFLNLGQGDRLGHALALGISPKQYYRVKDNTVWLPAQDLLDNLVWLLHRSLEWDVDVPNSLREKLQQRAQQLLDTIYPNEDNDSTPITLRTYYEAWQLRSDDPELYWNYLCGDEYTKKVLENSSVPALHPYKRAMLDRSKDSNGVDSRARLRRSKLICRILCRYHFGIKERADGEKIVRFVATPDYAAVLEKIQVRMMEIIMVKGIAVECNPSSNHLIGTFDRYEEHPIFRFNHFGLSLPEYAGSSGQIRVSVNTDDQGIFDTSIENEYALLFGALCMKQDAAGRPRLSHDEILAYIDHLRTMGNDMTFPKAERTLWAERL